MQLSDREDRATEGRIASADARTAAPPTRAARPGAAAAPRDVGSGPELDEARTAPVAIQAPPSTGSAVRRPRRVVDPADVVRSGVVHQAAALLAVAGFVLAITLQTPVIALAAAICAVTVPPVLTAVLGVQSHAAGPLVTSTLPRTLLALVVVLVQTSSAPAAVVCGSIAAAVLLEPVLARVSTATAPLAAHLPGISVRATAPLRPGRVTLINTAVAVVVGVAAALPVPMWFLLVLSLGALLLTIAALADAVARLVARRRAEQGLRRLVTAQEPLFALHWDALPGTEYQVTMWLPYLERIGAPFIIIVRNPASFAGIAAVTDRPVIVREDHRDLDPVVVPSLRAAFYVNNAARNTHLVRFAALKHVQLNHGESDKAPSYSPVFRLYDHDFVAGQAAIDRFAANGVAIPRELFTIVGRPQVEDILIGASTSTERTALYAPTWGGSYSDSDYCSLPIGGAVVESLLKRGYRVIFRPHPYTRQYPAHAREADRIEAILEAHARRSGVDHLFGAAATTDLGLIDCFNAADLLVSDVSSVVPDFLYSEKPFAVIAMQGSVGEFARAYPIAKAAYVIDRKGRNLEYVLDSMTKGDPVAPARRAAKSYFLGDLPGDRYADTFIDAARAVVGLG